MFSRIRKILVYTSAIRDENGRIRKQIMEDNRKAAVILTDRGVDAGECLERMEKICSGWKGRYVDGISISYGFASSEEFPDIAAVERNADRRMYEFKQNYYAGSGKERRGNPDR